MAAEFTSFPANWRGLTMHNELWQYAGRVYALPGVETACLELQATGANVCLALCALWLEHRQVRWSSAGAETLETRARVWAEAVVNPLRALRQGWRAEAQHDAALGSIRNEVKRLELEAEHVLLQRLEQATAGWPTGPSADPAWLTWAVADVGARLALREAMAQG